MGHKIKSYYEYFVLLPVDKGKKIDFNIFILFSFTK